VTGSFDHAIEECSRVLKIHGRVLPTTLEHVRLWAELDDGTTVCGETQIGSGAGACRRVWLDPVPVGHAPAVEAILTADLVLLDLRMPVMGGYDMLRSLRQTLRLDTDPRSAPTANRPAAAVHDRGLGGPSAPPT